MAWKPSNRFVRAFGVADPFVTMGLALLLIVAATSKAVNRESPIDFPKALEVIVFVELAVALILLFHRTDRACRLAGAMLFAVLGMFAVAAVIQGRASCDCLGKVAVWPGSLAGVDAFAFVWLLIGSLFALPAPRPTAVRMSSVQSAGVLEQIERVGS